MLLISLLEESLNISKTISFLWGLTVFDVEGHSAKVISLSFYFTIKLITINHDIGSMQEGGGSSNLPKHTLSLRTSCGIFSVWTLFLHYNYLNIQEI